MILYKEKQKLKQGKGCPRDLGKEKSVIHTIHLPLFLAAQKIQLQDPEDLCGLFGFGRDLESTTFHSAQELFLASLVLRDRSQHWGSCGPGD